MSEEALKSGYFIPVTYDYGRKSSSCSSQGTLAVLFLCPVSGVRSCSSCSSYNGYEHHHLSVLFSFTVGRSLFGVQSTVRNLHGFKTVSSCRDLTLSSSSPTKISQLPRSSLDQSLILPHHQFKQGANRLY